MAAILIAAGFAVAEKIDKKKQAKKEKKAMDERRYRELQAETKQRLARTASGNVVPVDEDASSESENESEEVRRQGGSVGGASGGAGGGVPPPPRYEDVVAAGRKPK